MAITLSDLEDTKQWHALAWLRETGEVGPTLDLLRSDKPLATALRNELARWIEAGAKRKRGSKVAVDPWKEFPPKLAESMGSPTTKKQRRAWRLFATWPISHTVAHVTAGMFPVRGGPRTSESMAIKHVAAEVGITERTARAWFNRFYPDGY